MAVGTETVAPVEMGHGVRVQQARQAGDGGPDGECGVKLFRRAARMWRGEKRGMTVSVGILASSAARGPQWSPVRYLRLDRWDGLDQSIAVFVLQASRGGAWISAVDGVISPMFSNYLWNLANDQETTASSKAVSMPVRTAYLEMDLGAAVPVDFVRLNTKGYSAGLRLQGLDAARAPVFSVDFAAGCPADIRLSPLTDVSSYV